jgi:trimeric autotransporter adhesin
VQILQLSSAVSAGGDITAYSSDKRLKDNITLIPNALEKVMSIRGVTFDWNDTSFYAGFHPKIRHNDAGVIAQEIQAVLPQAVDYAPFDRDDEGNSRSGENYLTVKYEKIVPLLIEAIKEQQSTIASLEARINSLESK